MDKKVFREIKIQKFRSLLIVSIVTVTVAMILGMRAGYPMIMATYEENLRHNNVADGRFTLTAPIPHSNITQIRNDAEFLRSNNIADIEGRLIIYSEMQYAEETFPCIVIGVNFPNLINKVYLEENSTFAAENSNFLQNKSNCIIESQFAGDLLGQDVQIGENISVLLGADDHQITVEAIGQDTDFIYVVDPVSQMTLMGQLAVVWMDLSELQEQLLGGAPLINQILFTVEERLDKPLIHTARDALLHKFATNQIDISTLQFEIYDETLDRQFFDADAGSMDKMGTLFGVIGLTDSDMNSESVPESGTNLVEVVRVIDGDTIEIDNGNIVRLLGIDSPEQGECYYEEAKEEDGWSEEEYDETDETVGENGTIAEEELVEEEGAVEDDELRKQMSDYVESNKDDISILRSTLKRIIESKKGPKK